MATPGEHLPVGGSFLLVNQCQANPLVGPHWGWLGKSAVPGLLNSMGSLFRTAGMHRHDPQNLSWKPSRLKPATGAVLRCRLAAAPRRLRLNQN